MRQGQGTVLCNWERLESWGRLQGGEQCCWIREGWPRVQLEHRLRPGWMFVCWAARVWWPHNLSRGRQGWEKAKHVCLEFVTAKFCLVRLSTTFFNISPETWKLLVSLLRMLLKETGFVTWQQRLLFNQHQAKNTGICHSGCCWEQTVLCTYLLLIQNLFGGQFSCRQ